MIGNPTRPGDLAVVIKGVGAGMFVRVLACVPSVYNGRDREVTALGYSEAVWDFGAPCEVVPGDTCLARDVELKPIRPPAPEESVDRAEHLAGVV